MIKFKITVETKNRSKIMIEDEFDVDSKTELTTAIHEAIGTDSVKIKDYIFKCENVNYICVEQVE